MRPLPGAVVEDGDAVEFNSSNHHLDEFNHPHECFSEKVNDQSGFPDHQTIAADVDTTQVRSMIPSKPSKDKDGDDVRAPLLAEVPPECMGLLFSIAEQQENLKDMITAYHEDLLARVNILSIKSGGKDKYAKTLSGSVRAPDGPSERKPRNSIARLKESASVLDLEPVLDDFDKITRKPDFQMSDSDGRFLARFQVLCATMMHHRAFEIGIASLIILNAICFAAQLDWSVNNVGEETPTFFRVVQMFFTIAFMLEICLRMFVDGFFFFNWKHAGFGWNVFDSFLVLISLVEEIFGRMNSLPNVLAIRVLRILRVLRVLRAFRVLRFFRDLRIMIRGITSSLKPLAWALSLLLLVMFTFGMGIMHFVAEALAHPGTTDQTIQDGLVEHYGSVFDTLYTLFAAITGGDDWVRFVEPLRHISEVLTCVFCSYVAFATFCVLNIVLGVFVDNATKTSAQDEDELLISEIEARSKQIDEIRKVFLSHDQDNSNELDWEEFQNHMSDVRVKYAMRRLGVDLDTISLDNLFSMLDFDQSGSIGIEEFILGIQMFHGNARSIDVAKVRYELGSIKELVKELIGATAPET